MSSDEPILTAEQARQLSVTDEAVDELEDWLDALLEEDRVDPHTIRGALSGMAGGLQARGVDSTWSFGQAQLTVELMDLLREAVEDERVDWWGARDAAQDAQWFAHQEGLREQGERMTRSDVLEEIREDFDGNADAWYQEWGGDGRGSP